MSEFYFNTCLTILKLLFEISDVHVHIDVYTAQTGVSRFTQLRDSWRYSLIQLRHWFYLIFPCMFCIPSLFGSQLLPQCFRSFAFFSNFIHHFCVCACVCAVWFQLQQNRGSSPGECWHAVLFPPNARRSVRESFRIGTVCINTHGSVLHPFI